MKHNITRPPTIAIDLIAPRFALVAIAQHQTIVVGAGFDVASSFFC